MDQAAVVQHRQVEAAAVPGDELRREFLDAVEEALDDLALPRFGLGQRAHQELLGVAQHVGDDHHALQVQRQEIAAVPGALLLEGELGDLAVGQFAIELVQDAQPGDVGNGLDVEDQHRRHAGNTPVDR